MRAPSSGEIVVKSDDSAEAIRRRMAELRRELSTDVREVRQSAKEMANPLYYLRRFPWASAAIAAGIGYMLVPKKKQIIQPDPEMLAEMFKKHQINLDPSKASPQTQSMLKSLAVMGLTWAVRTGLAYAGEQLAHATKHGNQNKAQDELHEGEETSTEPLPVEEPWNMTG
jgi:hypothetical protein